MIRVAIIAGSGSRARALAELVAEDERFQVVEARTSISGVVRAEVAILAGFVADQIVDIGVPTVVLSDESPADAGFGRMVRAWLPLSSSTAEISAAIASAASDLTVLTRDQARHWVRAGGPETDSGSAPQERLTRREMQVLRMLADGLENKEIARQLKISEHTAKFHVAQILAKLRASGRAEAVAIGIRRGLVPI